MNPGKRILIVENSFPSDLPHFGPSLGDPDDEWHAVETMEVLNQEGYNCEFRFTCELRVIPCEWVQDGVILINKQTPLNDPMFMSEGFRGHIQNALAWSLDAPIIMAAGNGGRELNKSVWMSSPAICVGAEYEVGKRTVDTNYGNQVDVWADGFDSNRRRIGTSWAAPRIAAQTAKILQQFRSYKHRLDAWEMELLWRQWKRYERVCDYLDGFPVALDWDRDGKVGFGDYLEIIGLLRKKWGQRRRRYM